MHEISVLVLDIIRLKSTAYSIYDPQKLLNQIYQDQL